MKAHLPLELLDLKTTIFIKNKDGKLLADVAQKDHAEFICRACNCHYELLEVCKEALYVLNRTGADLAIEELLKKVIAKAEGKE